MSNVLNAFHPLVRQWFTAYIGTPTDAQERAWPEIGAGRHVLVTAPTGSGKTLTAFLWALNQLITGQWTQGTTRVLYVSPMKALNNDVQRNLLQPLEELRGIFARNSETFPEIRVATRSGDTPSSERQRMARKPPEVLITTPESLNLILSSPKSRAMLSGIETVILDEIHAVAGGKRGIHLITAVDRIVPLAGEFQRIALSATVRPLDAVARFLGGYKLVTNAGAAEYEPRRVEVIESSTQKAYEIGIHHTPTESDGSEETSPWPYLASALKEIIRAHESTLIFTNSRRLCERLALFINHGEDELLAYSHHGSVSREMRLVVEERLKAGSLKAIVATNSLELGIDIGELDQVVLVQTPLSVASALQRIGRAGHQVGAVSKGVLFPTFARDVVDAAVMVEAVHEGHIEELRPVHGALDVLAQVIVSMTGVESWDLDALYAFVRTSEPYHGISREQFDLVVKMLAGRYAGSRLRSLQPSVSVDAVDKTIKGKPASLRSIYSSGGTIPDRGYFALRRSDTKSKIGELDEEFVWERYLGDRFTFGTQTWKIQQITHNDVLVTPATPRPGMVPFWRADSQDRGFHFSERLLEFLETADGDMDRREFIERLESRAAMEPDASRALVEFLKRQRTETGANLPHRRHVVVEYCTDHRRGGEHTQLIAHTLWGGRVNRPLAFAIAQAWEERTGESLEVFADNDAIVAVLPRNVERLDLFELAPSDDLEMLLRKRLERTGFFGARFRENAARALLLPRQSFGKRMPLWMNRLRAKELLNAVAGYDDFPIIAETWRTCLQDEFDIATLKQLLDEIREGVIAQTTVDTSKPSPFAEGIVWQQTNKYMYMDDSPESPLTSSISDDVLREVVFSADVRPKIDPELARVFEEKLQRVFPGYAPRTSGDLLDWVKERLFVPADEWDLLLRAVERDIGASSKSILKPLALKLVRVSLDSGWSGVVAVEGAARFLEVFGLRGETPSFSPVSGKTAPRLPAPESADGSGDSVSAWLAEWLRHYGPQIEDRVAESLPVDHAELEAALNDLVDAQDVVMGHLTANAQDIQICDAENMEILLRLARREARPEFRPLSLQFLPLFLADRHGLTTEPKSSPALETVFEPLLGLPMPADLVESAVLPARIPNYKPAMLDTFMSESGLQWMGGGQRKIFFCLSQNRDLFQPPSEAGHDGGNQWEEIAGKLFPSRVGRFTFDDLVSYTDLNSKELTESLWEFTWEGRITNDSFQALRKGLETKFRPWEPDSRRHASRRGFSAWKATRPFSGHWLYLPPPESPVDALEEEELNKERVRVLLDRYGVIFRELLQQELPPLRWGPLFRTLRRMELSGEILAGQFFEGIPGIQFASRPALERLRRPLPEEIVFWLSAADPASLCGVDLDELKPFLPKRLKTTHLVYHGTRLVVISYKTGKELEIRVAADDLNLTRYLSALQNLLNRPRSGRSSITVKTINGEAAPQSPYAGPLRECFNAEAGPKELTLWRR